MPAILLAGLAVADEKKVSPVSSVSPPALDDVEHMCALLTGCDKLPLPSLPKDFTACMKSMEEELASGAAVTFSLTLRECGLKASSCGALRTCALRGAKVDFCAGRGKSGAVELCDADGRAVTCKDEKVSLVRDCPRGGEQCVVADGHAICALGACDQDATPYCSKSATRIFECKKGKLRSLDCDAFGLTCVTDKESPVCATKGASCTEGSTRCDKDVAVACFHGHEVKVDCGAAGMSCGGTGSKLGACVAKAPAEGACDASDKPKCDGATLKWCAWGSPRSYLCKSMGFSKCVTDESGAHCSG